MKSKKDSIFLIFFFYDEIIDEVWLENDESFIKLFSLNILIEILI